MPFPSLVIETPPPPPAGLSSRADVAMFVGLLARRPARVPERIKTALAAAGFARAPEAMEALLDMPVEIESWGQFDSLFAWDERPVAEGDPRRIPCPLGLAVKSFFAEGGVKAIVVRCGDPLPLTAGAADKRRLLAWAPAPPPGAALRAPILPGFRVARQPDAHDPRTWTGASHVFGTDEAAMLCLPDLPELLSGAPVASPLPPDPPPAAERFKPCAPEAPGYVPDPRGSRLAFAAPRLDRAGYRDWAAALRHMLDLLAKPRGPAHRRDVMLVASLPLPARAPGNAPEGCEAWPLALLAEPDLPASGMKLLDGDSIGSARLQLAYPWIETADTAMLPDGIAGGEGVLAGAIARTALNHGAFRSAAGTPLASVRRTLPELGTAALRRGLPGKAADWLGDRLCLIGARLDGFALLSDATMAHDRAWRAGGVSRLMGIVLRACRWLGQERLFDAAGPALWGGIRSELEAFLERLRLAGALGGAGPAEAYTVRCDATTMSQADIDNGRAIATVSLLAAQPVERIAVTLALGESGTARAREAA